jgi:hypothetical protein
MKLKSFIMAIFLVLSSHSSWAKDFPTFKAADDGGQSTIIYVNFGPDSLTATEAQLFLNRQQSAGRITRVVKQTADIPGGTTDLYCYEFKSIEAVNETGAILTAFNNARYAPGSLEPDSVITVNGNIGSCPKS